MSAHEPNSVERIESTVAGEGVVNVRDATDADPEVRSVFVDTLDGEAVACSCPDWSRRKPAGGCEHIQYVNTEEGLLARACGGGGSA